MWAFSDILGWFGLVVLELMGFGQDAGFYGPFRYVQWGPY